MMEPLSIGHEHNSNIRGARQIWVASAQHKIVKYKRHAPTNKKSLRLSAIVPALMKHTLVAHATHMLIPFTPISFTSYSRVEFGGTPLLGMPCAP